MSQGGSGNATIPFAKCEGANLQWNGKGDYSMTPGHWFCFTDDDITAYEDGYNKCASNADARGVPEKWIPYWCGGWPAAGSIGQIPGATPPSELPIDYLIPVVLLLVGIGLFFWYRYSQ